MRTWVKVVLCLVALDVLLFRVGIFWGVRPDFGPGLGGENWRFLFSSAGAFETRRTTPGPSQAVGSSIVIFGVDERQVNQQLQRDGIPPLLRLVTHGSTATDSALLTWNSLPMHPWLVVYGAAARDYPKAGATDSAVSRIFYDGSIELPALPRSGAEDMLDANVRRVWKLYRYRFFAARALETWAGDLAVGVGLPRPAFAGTPDSPPTGLPPEALRYFSAFRITPKSWAAWSKWRESRQFADYLKWLQIGSRALHLYKSQTLATYGPEQNPQVDSLRRMLDFSRRAGVRFVLVYFPENPVFHDPAARAYFDPALSRAYADLFAREAAAHGARFVDLRDFVEPEGFYDMIHLNLVGARKVSQRLTEIIEEEWHARAQHSREDSTR